MPQRTFSLRMKLTVWYLLIFAAIEATLMTAVYLLDRQKDSERLDDRLLRWERMISRRLASKEPRYTWTEETLGRAMPWDAELEFVVIRDQEGLEVISYGDVDPRQLPPAAPPPSGRPMLDDVGAEQAGRITRLAEPLRLVTSAFRDPGGDLYSLQAAANRRALRGTPPAELNLFLLAGPIGLFAAGVAAWFLAGRAVAPMNQLSEAVRSVSPETIDTRVQLERREEEIAHLQDELNEALERLAEGYRAQERFITNVAHDLKTPIAVLLTQAQVLKPRSSVPGSYEAFRRLVEDEMRRLGGLLESFLTLARADQGQALTRREPVRVPDVVVESVEHCDAEARQCEVGLVPNIIVPEDGSVEPVLVGDPDLLCAMLDNVIRNGVRFSPAHESVEIEALCQDHEAVITVRDQGPGIPQEYLGTIFERFVRAPQDESLHRGSGLGLAIARSVAELHGGTITARNGHRGGCEIEVRLPLSNADAPGAAPSPP